MRGCVAFQFGENQQMAKSTGGNPKTKTRDFKSFGVVVGQYNPEFSKVLEESARKELFNLEPETPVDFFAVPGAFEIPLVAKQAAQSKRYNAVICLGAIIRGATPHFDYVAGESARGIAQVSLETNVPVIYGVLTTDTIEQAIERAGTKSGNKGADAAMAAIEMSNLTSMLNKNSHYYENELAHH